MDLGTATLVVGLVGILVAAVFNFPAFLNQLLDLRKRWKVEFPPKTLEELLASIPARYQNPRALLLGFRIAVVRSVIGIFNIALIAYVFDGLLTGNSFETTYLVLFDCWVTFWAAFALVLWRRMRATITFFNAVQLAEKDGRKLPKPPW